MQEHVMKRPSSSQNSARITVSTNFVEGFLGNVKVVSAKRGLLGGGASKNARLNALSSAWLLKNSGVAALGQAMLAYTKALGIMVFDMIRL